MGHLGAHAKVVGRFCLNVGKQLETPLRWRSELVENGAFIQALASDYRGAAGVEPVFVIADELWGFTSESSQRLYEECCPTPTRHPSVRMIVSYAGFTGESILLESLVKRGKAGKQIAKDLYAQPRMIAFISHERIAPWQSEKWLEEARQSTRPSTFLRQYCNEFTSGESTFINLARWDNCIDAELRPELRAAGSLAVILLWTYYSALIYPLGVELTQVWVRNQGREVPPKKGAVRLEARSVSG